MPPVGFEPTVSEGERPQTYTLDRAATGTGPQVYYRVIFNLIPIKARRQGTAGIISVCCEHSHNCNSRKAVNKLSGHYLHQLDFSELFFPKLVVTLQGRNVIYFDKDPVRTAQ